ncbi:MAG: peptidyl-prolyl cis-trans isomerase [Lachnospiraceae bacterium]|nr:peptidyl-prolyl cis-trans isomerase [Lachnospiraceae bacterium]
MKTGKRIVTAVCTIVLAATALLGSGCGKKEAGTIMEQYEGKVAVTINDKKVMMPDVMYQIFGTEINGNYYDSFYQTYYGMSFWDQSYTDEETGETMSMRDYLREQTMEGIVMQEVLAMQAEKEGISLDEDEIAEYQAEITSLLEQIGTEEEEDSFAYIGFTKENLEEQFQVMALGAKYYGMLEESFDIDEEAIRAEMNYEDYREYVTEYLFAPTVEYDDEYNMVALAEEELEKNQSVMEEALALVKEGKDFETIVAELVENGDIATSTLSFTKDDLSAEDEYIDAAMTLAVGECTEIVETEYGFYIIKLTDDESQAAYEEAVTEAVETKLSEAVLAKYEEIKAGYTVTVNNEVWDALVFGNVTIQEEEAAEE